MSLGAQSRRTKSREMGLDMRSIMNLSLRYMVPESNPSDTNLSVMLLHMRVVSQVWIHEPYSMFNIIWDVVYDDGREGEPRSGFLQRHS